MKKLIFLMAIIVLLVGGCLKLDYEKEKKPEPKPEPVVQEELKFEKTENFKDIFEQVIMIDKKYEINYKKEKLFGSIANPDRIKPALADLRKLRSVLSPEAKTTETIVDTKNKERTELDIGLLFVDARISMLEAERYFHLGYSFGNQGLLGDGFYCVEAPIINQSLNYFEMAAFNALDATYYLDLVLTDNKYTWEFVGIEDEKSDFYHTPTQDIFAQVRANRKILLKYCGDEPADSKRYVTFQGTDFKDLFVYRLLEARIVGDEVNTNA